jgi:uncharacterized membrane protein
MKSSAARVAGTLFAAVASGARWLARHQALCLILFLSFVARLFLADWNSYWYDEILSVVMYGSSHKTIVSAMQALAGESAHPPLYHFILFHWMQVFGNGEVATRTLSNLYITGATFCLYLLALRVFGRRVAIASALVFALSYTPTFFALEVRSYAQSLFLVTLSSLLLLRWLDRLDGSPTWRQFFTGRGAVLLLCNAALLLTHYSNALFLIAQALFVGALLAHRNRSGTRLLTVAKGATFYVCQFAIAFALWGPVALATQKRFAENERFTVHGLPDRDPLSIFVDLVVRPNFDLPRFIYLVILVLLAIALVRISIRHFRRGREASPLQAYFLFYLIAWAMVPSVLAYLVFFASGSERYITRYFAFCVPPLSILLVLAIEQFIESVHSARRWFRFSVRRHYLGNAALYAVLIGAIFALPGGYAAATFRKEPYREIARSITTLVQRDKGASFALYEAAHRKQPMLNYYMKRFSKRVRFNGTLRLSDEEKGGNPLARAKEEIATKTYLVVAFPHITTLKFPTLMQQLRNKYDFVFSQLADGLGYIVVKPRPAEKQ